MADTVKHTEAPWERVDTADYAEIHPVGKRLHSAIALVAKPQDADLIAAAPDLLDAAKEALSVLRTASCQLSEDHRLVLGGRRWGWRTIAKLEGLIDKAEGRS